MKSLGEGSNWRGVAAASPAAVLCGVSAPLAKAISPRVDPVRMARLLYLGSGLGLGAYAWRRARRIRISGRQNMIFPQLAIPNPRPEDRRPKETRRPKSELIATPAEQLPIESGHSRNSNFRAAEHDLPSTGRTLEQPCRGGLSEENEFAQIESLAIVLQLNGSICRICEPL